MAKGVYSGIKYVMGSFLNILCLLAVSSHGSSSLVDLSSPAARYTHSIVVPRVPMLRFLLRENTGDPCVQNITVCPDVVIAPQNCTFDGYVFCCQLNTSEMEKCGLQSFMFEYGRSPESRVHVLIDPTYSVGCSNYMYPQNATIDGSTNPASITLSCVPVPVNASEFVGNVTTEWRRFSQLEALSSFLQNCSNSPKNCANSFRNTVVTCKNSGEYLPTKYNLTITNPQSNQAWFVPSFTLNDNSTYPAPYTFLYPSTGWPRITSHYKCALEVVEPASNYGELKCEANSFPPMKTFEWTRGEGGEAVNIHSDDRYLFNNITANNLNGSVTITEVVPAVDNALFTCTIIDLGGRLTTDVSLSVRLRVTAIATSTIVIIATLGGAFGVVFLLTSLVVILLWRRKRSKLGSNEITEQLKCTTL